MKSIGGRLLLGISLLLLLGAVIVVKTYRHVSARDSRVIVTKVLPRMNGSDGAALSPDGSLLALVHTDWVGLGGNSVIEVREVKSSRVIASYSMSTTGRGDHFSQHFNRLQYCDAGKYLLASDWDSKFYVLDTKTYQPHKVIDLNAIQLRLTPGGYASPSPTLWSACAANGNVLIFQIVGGRFRRGVTKLFNLDTGMELEGFTDGVGSMGGGDVAVSPGGLSVAYVAEDSVIVVDLQTKESRAINWRAEQMANRKIAFAGESAIALAENVPSEKEKSVVHLMDIRSGLEIRTFGDPKNGAFRYLGASADGGVVFAYSAKNSYCKTCNYFRGKYTIESPHFTLWDRETGRVIAESPKLELKDNTCNLIIFGSCEAFDEEPELQLSQEGNAVLATWQSGGEPVEVFIRR